MDGNRLVVRRHADRIKRAAVAAADSARRRTSCDRLETAAAAAASLGALREEAADCHTLGMAAEAEGLEETAAQMQRVLVDDEAAVEVPALLCCARVQARLDDVDVAEARAAGQLAGPAKYRGREGRALLAH